MAKVKIGNILNCIFNRGVLSTIWSSTAAYTAGQYVAYGNYFYRCIKNASAGTLPTDTTYWVKTDLASEITSLNSNLAKRFSYTITNAGVTVPNNVHVNAIVIGHYTNDHYLLDVTVQGIILSNGTDESFELLNMSVLLSPIKSALGKNNVFISDEDEDEAFPLVNNGCFDNTAFGSTAIINNHFVGFGRFYNNSLYYGKWPMNSMKQNGKYSFRFYAEIY